MQEQQMFACSPPIDRYTWSCVRKCAIDVITKDLRNPRASTPLWAGAGRIICLATLHSGTAPALHSIARSRKLHAALHSIARFGKLHAARHSIQHCTVWQVARCTTLHRTLLAQHKHISIDPRMHLVYATILHIKPSH